MHLCDVYVGSPRNGVNGSVQTTNVAFTFWDGRLHTVTRLDVISPHGGLKEVYANLAQKGSLVDSNGAYQLATQWLSAISVDVLALEQRFAPAITQRCYFAGINGNREEELATARRQMLPIFDVAWGNPMRSEIERPAIKVSVLGTSKQLLDLQLAEPSYLRRPVLAVRDVVNAETNETVRSLTNTPASFASAGNIWKRPRWTPSPDLDQSQRPEWIEQFFGGPRVVETLRQPEIVNAFVLKTAEVMDVHTNIVQFATKRGPVSVPPETAKHLADVILSFSSYDWSVQPFAPAYIVRLQFLLQTNTVDVLLAFDENALWLHGPERRSPEISFRPAHAELLRLVKTLFPSQSLQDSAESEP
jgi:hypothetical protein